MKIANYLTAWKNLDAMLRVYKFGFLLAVGCIIFLVIYLQIVQSKQKTVIIPTHLAAKIEVSDIEASPAYVRAMGQYFADLLYDFTPYNIEKRYRELLSFVSADVFPELKEILDKKITKTQKVGIIQDFQIDAVYVLQNRRCLIRGKARRFVGSELVGNEMKNVIIQYKIVDGGMYVEGIKEIDDTEYNNLVRR
jgi:type IV conjugative transfer system protein TraE